MRRLFSPAGKYLVRMVMVMLMAARFMLMVVMLMMAAFLPMRLFQQSCQLASLLQSMYDRFLAQLRPGRRDDGCLLILIPQHMNAFLNLIIAHGLRTADNDGRGMLHLIFEEFSEVLQV